MKLKEVITNIIHTMTFRNEKGRAESFKATLGDIVSYLNPTTLQNEKGIVHGMDVDGNYSIIPLTTPKIQIHNDMISGTQTSLAPPKVFSVIITHEAEVHHNWMFTDYEKAKAKVEAIKAEWDKKYGANKHYEVNAFTPRGNDDYIVKTFGYQYASQIGYRYTDGEYEYGEVVLMETPVE